jgi:hypothetical protein
MPDNVVSTSPAPWQPKNYGSFQSDKRTDKQRSADTAATQRYFAKHGLGKDGLPDSSPIRHGGIRGFVENFIPETVTSAENLVGDITGRRTRQEFAGWNRNLQPNYSGGAPWQTRTVPSGKPSVGQTALDAFGVAAPFIPWGKAAGAVAKAAAPVVKPVAEAAGKTVAPAAKGAAAGVAGVLRGVQMGAEKMAQNTAGKVAGLGLAASMALHNAPQFMERSVVPSISRVIGEAPKALQGLSHQFSHLLGGGSEAVAQAAAPVTKAVVGKTTAKSAAGKIAGGVAAKSMGAIGAEAGASSLSNQDREEQQFRNQQQQYNSSGRSYDPSKPYPGQRVPREEGKGTYFGGSGGPSNFAGEGQVIRRVY